MDFVFPGGMAGQLDPTNVDVLVNKPLENQRKKEMWDLVAVWALSV